MNLIELDRALKQLRLGGMAAVLETRLRNEYYQNGNRNSCHDTGQS